MDQHKFLEKMVRLTELLETLIVAKLMTKGWSNTEMEEFQNQVGACFRDELRNMDSQRTSEEYIVTEERLHAVK